MIDMIIRNITGLLAPGGARARLSILIYHRVLRQPDPLSPDQITVNDFDVQMRVLAQQFKVLPLSEAVYRLKSGDLPSRSACITFDDGYADNAEVALPVLQKYGLSATFFIATGFLDGGVMWNDAIIETVRKIKQDEINLSHLGLGNVAVNTVKQRIGLINMLIQKLKFMEVNERIKRVQTVSEAADTKLPDNLMMTTQQVRQLDEAGMEIGAHTVNHPILTSTQHDVARDEIAQSKEKLEQILGKPVQLFAYPNGMPDRDYNSEHVQLVRDLGFSAAVSTAWGVARPDADLYQLPRFTPWQRSAQRFAFELLRNCMRSNYALVPVN